MAIDTEYKQTPIGKIPKDWKVARLGDKEICEELYYGVTAKATEKNTGIKMLRTTDIKNYCVDWSNLPFCEITEKRNNLDKYFLEKGDIIIARAGTVGVSVLVEKNFRDTVFGSYLIKLKLKQRLHPKFIHYFFQSNIYWRHLKKAQGSTLKNINLPLLKSLLIPLPPLPEQKAIAKILSTVDEAIQKVDEVIAKTERLKKGLMQKLLTKGIGHKEFKYSKELGCEIPKEWKVTKLKDIIRYEKGKKPKIMIEEQKEGYLPYLTADNLRTGVFTQWVREDRDVVKVDKNDIILIWDGFYCGFTFRGFEGILSSTMVKVEPRPGINENFLFYVLKTRFRELNTKISGMYLKHVNKTVFENLKIPLPPLPEQQKIAEILSTVDKKLELERKRKEKLERIKKGLMNDLLTGRKRVRLSDWKT